MSAVGAVSVFAAEAFVGSIFVDHRIHAAGRHGKEEPRASQLGEIAVVSVPIGLRNDGYTQTGSL